MDLGAGSSRSSLKKKKKKKQQQSGGMGCGEFKEKGFDFFLGLIYTQPLVAFHKEHMQKVRQLEIENQAQGQFPSEVEGHKGKGPCFSQLLGMS